MIDRVDGLAEQMVVLGARVYPLFRQIFKGYHPDEIAMLHILRRNNGELSRRKLIDELGIEEKMVSRRIRNLVSRGLVESHRKETTAREVIDRITSKGNYEFSNIRKKMKLLIKEGFRFVRKEEQVVLNDIIKGVNCKMEIIVEIVKQVVQ